jgi:sulfur-carrier protein adenylyltransferase/sulfurtransferase
LDPDDPIVVYCRSGGRSARIVQFLRASGFSNVLNLKGGVLGWRAEVDPSLREY